MCKNKFLRPYRINQLVESEQYFCVSREIQNRVSFPMSGWGK